MPKRKCDLDYLSSEIRKLKKKIKRARKHNVSSSSESIEESDPSALLGLAEPSAEEEIAVLGLAEPSAEEEVAAFTEDAASDPDPQKHSIDPTTSLVELTSSELPDENTLDKDVMEILGEDPVNKILFGPEIHKELASRLQHITSTGLTKEAKKELQLKYLLPQNAVLLGAPKLNPEIKAALPETLVARDKALEAKQNLLGAAISCVASVTSKLLGSQHKDTDTLKKLMDGCRILCEIQHADTNTRRMFSSSALKKEIKSQIMTSKIDAFLFGEHLADTLKTAKAVSKSSAEIKVSHNTNRKPQTSASTSKANHLNARAPAGPSRKPPVTAPPVARNRQPAFRQTQPARQSRPSSQPPKNNTQYRRA